MKRCDRISLAISDALDARRRALNLTQRALAERLGQTENTVSQQLDGRTMRTSTIAKYEAALHCRVTIDIQPTTPPLTTRIQ